MRKIIFGIGVAVFSATMAFGQSAGGGISFFFPESLLEGSGSVSKESGLSTSIGFGNYLSVPIGFTYIKASGLMAYKDTDDDGNKEMLDDQIWYVADTFIPYLRLKGSLDLGPMYLEGFGGIAGMWVVAPQAFDGAMGRYYGGEQGGEYYVFRALSSDFNFGFGYQFGATAGVRINAVKVGLEAVYTDLSAKASISSDDFDYYDGSTTVTENDFSQSFTARLRGISLGITGSFQF